MYKHFFKRFFDIILSLTGLAITSPLLISVWFILLFTNGPSGSFFVQIRPGKNGKLFHLIKFKTMNERRDNDGRLLQDFNRITTIGRLIRLLSIDELPQLLNVLRGDMSLVGPRPLLEHYLPLYSKRQARRHEVRPGITGWAQVNGRNAITWEEKFDYDVWYVDNISLWIDIKILLLTFIKVFSISGINATNGITMETFKGSKNL